MSRAWTVTLDAEQVLDDVASILKLHPRVRCIGYRSQGGWTGASELSIEGHAVVVREPRSPLEVRQVMVEASQAQLVLVLVTSLDPGELGKDVLARLYGNKLRTFRSWDPVKTRLRVREIDPQLTAEPHLAVFLLESIRQQGGLATPNGALTADIAWEHLFSASLGMPRDSTDAVTLLQWTTGGRPLTQPPELLQSARRWLQKKGGELPARIFDCVVAGYGEQALPVGVACGVVFAEPQLELAAAAARLERWTGGQPVAASVGEAWAAAARQVLEALPDSLRWEWRHKSDALLAEIGAEPWAWLHPLSLRGEEQRLDRLARAVLEDQPLETLEASLQEVLNAPLMAEARQERAAMAVRLKRWLTRPLTKAAGTFAEAASRYLRDGAFVDVARHALRQEEPGARLATAYQHLVQQATEKRELDNARFAELLVAWHSDGAPTHGVLGVEHVLAEVVAPFVRAGNRVLVVVLDGLSWPVAYELVRDIEHMGWALMESGKQKVSPVVAALPTVTEASRASLLCGGLLAGDSALEKSRFASNAELRGNGTHLPRLFHKADLPQAGLSEDLRDALEDDQRVVVGVVLNTVDDTLAKDDQLHPRWTVEMIRPLGSLLTLADRTHRVVVLASDHGHILDCGTELRSCGGSARWSLPTSLPEADEIVVTGPRVLLGGGKVVVPWSEKVRYTTRHCGYHGGVTPQEALPPLLVLSPLGTTLKGWSPVPLRLPDWWDPEAARLRVSGKKKKPVPQMEFALALEPDAVEWVEALMGPPCRDADDTAARKLLIALAQAGDSATLSTLSQVVERPEALLRELMARINRLTALDGRRVVGLSDDLVVLDRTAIEKAPPVSPAIQGLLSKPETAALEAVMRHRTLTEAELTRILKTPRISGLMENLMEKLFAAGWNVVRKEEGGAAGHVYAYHDDKSIAQALINALRSGTVPATGLEHLAVGTDDVRGALQEQRTWVAAGNGGYKFLRGPYGSGKTFVTSLAAADALADGFVSSKVVISTADTPLYRLSEVYRKMCQGMATRTRANGALGSLVDRWLYSMEEQALEIDGIAEDSPAFQTAVARRLDVNLSLLGERAGRLASCLKAYHAAQLSGDFTERQGILDWLSGESKVNSSIKRAAGVSGQLDNTDALAFLRGWLELLRQANYRGLLLVLDEAEVVLRMKRPERVKSLEVLRQLVDAIDKNEFPGLHLLVTGTPDFFDSSAGLSTLEPLHDRIKVTFRDDLPDNLRQAQIRLRPFDLQRLRTVARRVQDIYPFADASRSVPDAFIDRMTDEVTRGFGGNVDVVPRLFLREFVNVLDLIDQHRDFDVSRWHFQPSSIAAGRDYVRRKSTPCAARRATCCCNLFHQLSSNLQHGLVHTLGWRDLRPVQEAAFESILAGANAVILAPTAGGKTEAAVLPVVECLLRRPCRGVGVLFLSPLRALLNNQEERVLRLTGLGGLTAFKWHGDVSTAKKMNFHAHPAHLLMLTPESLEVILAVPRYHEENLFGDLRFVIIDEVHAFVGKPRGDHLMALVERLTSYTSRDIQRIALSATVQNPEKLQAWLQGSSQRSTHLVRPESPPTNRTIEFHPLESKDEASGVVRSLTRGLKSLIFADSRGGVERMRDALSGTGVEPFVHHGSLSQELREEAEQAFRGDAAACIISTSTLELGLDVGDLDLVVQLDAPSTVCSFLQRLGRSGRRAGSQGRMAFVTDNELGFLQAVALVSLAVRRWVEPVEPSRRSAGVFVQQALARILQSGGLPRYALLEGVGKPACFADLVPEEREAILDRLLELEVLIPVDSVLVFGPWGERRFGSSNFIDLYSVFDTSDEMKVVTTNNKVIGTIETWFAQSLQKRDFVFVLGGRPWLVVEADWDRERLVVKPAPAGRIPSWLGDPKVLSPALCQEMRELLLGPIPPFVVGRAVEVFEGLQQEWRPLLQGDRPVVLQRADRTTLITFAGGRINKVYARLLELRFGISPVLSNVALRLPQAHEGAALRELFDQVRDADVTEDLLKALPQTPSSKFEDLLPEALRRETVAARLFDVEGAKRLAENGLAYVTIT